MNYTKQEVDIHEYEIQNLLPLIGLESTRQEILEGLYSTQKQISPKYFYNKEGGTLFERITELEEYYPTRCEKEILSKLPAVMAINFKNLDIIELGSGDASKISLLFKQLQGDVLETLNYFAIDIDQAAIEKSISQITSTYNINCTGIVTDFYHHLEISPSNRKRVFCFFGSTIGNFSPYEAKSFMKQLASKMKKGDILLLGADLIKDTSILEKAYNDKQLITEAFNKNILNTVNALLESDFDTKDFKHLAFYNAEKARIEMHLQSLRDLEIHSKHTSNSIQIHKGETIHTENSYKFNKVQLKELGENAELTLKNIFYDSQEYFSLSYFIK